MKQSTPVALALALSLSAATSAQAATAKRLDVVNQRRDFAVERGRHVDHHSRECAALACHRLECFVKVAEMG